MVQSRRVYAIFSGDYVMYMVTNVVKTLMKERRNKMKIKFRITDPFFLVPCIAIYHGLQVAWLWFEVDFVARKEE